MRRAALGLAVVAFVAAPSADAQTIGGMAGMGPASEAAPYGAPVGDERIYVHGVLDQLEVRAGAGEDSLYWDGEAWIGTDDNRLWLKSEGEDNSYGKVSDGRVEALYSRPITTYFDAQAGVRSDLDSRPGRTWAAFGVEGLAPYFFNIDSAVYVSGGGRLAARAMVSHDQLLTQRLILSPEAEVNLYSNDDHQRRIGSGLSDIDAGLRLRYEVTRKFAPYIGVVYEGRLGRTADLVRAAGERAGDVKLAVGLRGWF
jgi:copper resistance protein B